MFNVGDEVIAVDEGMLHTPKGSVGVVTRTWWSPRISEWFVDVEFGTHIEVGRVLSRFELNTSGSSAVERKIKRMYERQHRKTGLSCFKS